SRTLSQKGNGDRVTFVLLLRNFRKRLKRRQILVIQNRGYTSSPMALEAQAGKPCVDVSRYELSVNGKRVRLERQPMDLLILFVQRRGELVTRDEIIDKLWGKSVFVDVDRGINSAVRKIRSVFGDDPAHPHYLETVVGKGYRFVG